MYASRLSTNLTTNHMSIQEIRWKVSKLAEKNELVKYFATEVKGKVVSWRLELNGILQVFNVR